MNRVKTLRTPLFIALCVCAILACHSPQTLVKKDFESTQLNSRNPEDSAALQLIKPYKAILDQSMNEVLAQIEGTLSKEIPEGNLNNFVADALMEMANSNTTNPKVTCCVLNMGGIRLNELPAGNLTVGKCFELLPFENKLVQLTITGKQLQELLDLAAANKGWPIAGIRMTIQGAKAINCTVQGSPIDFSKEYVLLTNDYMANGGDNCSMLSATKQISYEWTMRDAFIAFCKSQGTNNKPIKAVKDGRIK